MQRLAETALDVDPINFQIARGLYRISEFNTFSEYASRVETDPRIHPLRQKAIREVNSDKHFKLINLAGRIGAGLFLGGLVGLMTHVSMNGP